ncbi:MAG: hypothetical protein KGN16_11290 [Burkholderiales bacterium]|nr:hypothetical protein [Burkholderiales bacterium]
MKIARAVSLGFALIGSSLAHGQSPAGTAQADFEFRTIPIEGANSSVHSVTPYRLFDTLVVTVSDPVLCGQKPLQPAVTIEKNRVSLSYKLTAAVAIGKPCTVVSEFIVKNLPNQDFEVAFSGGQEPYVVATMRKCPFYNPKAHDLWECLAPG